MKKLCLLFSFCPVLVWGQVKIDFENGLPENCRQFPAGRWEVSSINALEGENSLRHSFDNTESSTDVITFPIIEPDADSLIITSFSIQYEYNPSGSNNWGFYILSSGDAEEIYKDEHVSAIILGVNQAGASDSLFIYESIEGELKEVLNCKLNHEYDIGYDPWNFRVSIKNYEFLIVEGGPVGDELDTLSALMGYQLPQFYPLYSGLKYKYTSSKDRLLGLDRIEMFSSPYIDMIPPEIDQIEVHLPGVIKFGFSEEINIESEIILNANFPIDSSWISGNHLYCRLTVIPSDYTQLEFNISGITDRLNNSKKIIASFEYFYPDYHDVIFTEIMADPSPAVYMPEAEYLEIYNRSGITINLRNWSLITGSRVWTIPKIEIEAYDYHFFGAVDDFYYYSDSVHFTPLFSSASVFSNSGLDIFLFNQHNELIDILQYALSLYNDEIKSEGGWALERIDNDNLCGGKENWKASVDKLGGTPGRENSVSGFVEDRISPYITAVLFENDSTYRLRFSEILQRDIIEKNRNEILLANKNLLDISVIPPYFSECRLNITASSNPSLLVFQNFWQDCSGNISLSRDSILCVPPVNPVGGSVIITEVLFAPWPGCSEFIEIYNASDNILSLYDLKISVSDLSEITSDGDYFTTDEQLFYPGEYLVISRNTEVLKAYYDMPEKASVIEIPGLSSLPDNGARIALYDRSHTLIDEFIYSRDMHFPLVSDDHGVSLERIFLDNDLGSNSQWHSASSLCGFATPGYRNSQTLNTEIKDEEFYCEEEVFTPNNDGYMDQAIIHISMDKEGYLAMIRVFDAEGRLIRWLGNNILLGTTNKLAWDGRDERGLICPTGIYLIHMEAYHLSGSKRIFKEAVVLGRK